jgi:membrane-associated phospholipid phosphatase
MSPTAYRDQARQRRSWSYLLARVITEALAPAVIVTALMLAVGWHAARQGGHGLLWGLVAALFASLIPFAYILHNVRKGRVTDHHVGVREQRRLPLLVGLGSISIGLAVLGVLRAPRDLIAVIAAGSAGFAVALTISHWWKMSVHSAVAAGAVTILALVVGPELLLASPLVALVAWSRIKLRDHTPAQAVVGVLVGTAVAYTVFSLVR